MYNRKQTIDGTTHEYSNCRVKLKIFKYSELGFNFRGNGLDLLQKLGRHGNRVLDLELSRARGFVQAALTESNETVEVQVALIARLEILQAWRCLGTCVRGKARWCAQGEESCHLAPCLTDDQTGGLRWTRAYHGGVEVHVAKIRRR